MTVSTRLHKTRKSEYLKYSLPSAKRLRHYALLRHNYSLSENRLFSAQRLALPGCMSTRTVAEVNRNIAASLRDARTPAGLHL